MEDLKDLAQNGISDLFEYGQEFMIGGNALGDGSKPKDGNDTKSEDVQESFAEKYKKELMKDVDDLIDEVEEEETEEGDSVDDILDQMTEVDRLVGGDDDEEEPSTDDNSDAETAETEVKHTEEAEAGKEEGSAKKDGM